MVVFVDGARTLDGDGGGEGHVYKIAFCFNILARFCYIYCYNFNSCL